MVGKEISHGLWLYWNRAHTQTHYSDEPRIRLHVKHCLVFSFVFSAPSLAWRNLFSASGIFCGGRYQPGSTGIF
jgi:hypothetical protein